MVELDQIGKMFCSVCSLTCFIILFGGKKGKLQPLTLLLFNIMGLTDKPVFISAFAITVPLI